MTTEPTPRFSSGLADRYRIERELGRGGMATVYLAEDLRHHRRVAVKVLHSQAAESLGTERFLREIEIAAGLQHPHILPLYDSGEAVEPGASGQRLLYYVMPYVAGESLRQMLAREGPLPIATVARLLRDVADALAYAHAHGVVHRDIKPENVMVSDRHALVADFGIARAISTATGGAERPEAARGPSVPARVALTAGGLALGTPAYMSPEQATADGTVDHRADLYAFGVMAYEMLVGEPPFTASSTRGMLVAHLTTPPESVAARRPEVPEALATLVMRCLEKDPADRWQSADELVARLESIASAVDGAPASPGARSSGGRSGVRALAASLAAAVLFVIVASVWPWRELPPPTYRVGRVTALTTAPGLELDPALSPDGRTLAYVAGPPGRTRIYLRQIVRGGRDVPLTDPAAAPNQRWPQWSPDGQRILFQAGYRERQDREPSGVPGGTIYVVPALGGTPRAVVPASVDGEAFSPAWSPDGQRIVFVRDDTLFLVGADRAGAPSVLAVAEGAFAPRWSPDGTRIAYSTGNERFIFGTTHLANAAPAAIWVVRLSDRSVVRVVPDDALNVCPVWTPDSRALLYVSDRAGRRDVYRIAVRATGEPDGAPERVTTGIDAHTISLSADGTRLAYSAYTPVAHLWSLPMPVAGPVPAYAGTQLTFDQEGIEGIALSPDGKWLAFDSDRSGDYDVWRMPATGGTPVQLTADATGDHVQSWSPDGQELAIHSFRTGNRDVFTMRPDGTGVRQVTTSESSESNPVWGPDGNTLVIQSSGTGRDELYLWTRPRRDSAWSMRKQITTDGGSDPAFAPDGRWVAYVWGGALRLISPDGSAHRVLVAPPEPATRPAPAMPAWSPDSRTIYYMAYDEVRRGSIWSIGVDGGTPKLLVTFDDPTRPSLRRDFATDGRRLYFAVAEPASDIYLMELDSQ